MAPPIRTDDPGWTDPQPVIQALRDAGMLTTTRAGGYRLRTAGWQALICLAGIGSRQDVLPEDVDVLERVWEAIDESRVNRQ